MVDVIFAANGPRIVRGNWQAAKPHFLAAFDDVQRIAIAGRTQLDLVAFEVNYFQRLIAANAGDCFHNAASVFRDLSPVLVGCTWEHSVGKTPMPPAATAADHIVLFVVDASSTRWLIEPTRFGGFCFPVPAQSGAVQAVSKDGAQRSFTITVGNNVMGNFINVVGQDYSWASDGFAAFGGQIPASGSILHPVQRNFKVALAGASDLDTNVIPQFISLWRQYNSVQNKHCFDALKRLFDAETEHRIQCFSHSTDVFNDTEAVAKSPNF
jgi:hypothetical protein